jgi:hypothetical protein
MVLSSEIELWPAHIAKNIVEKGLSSDFKSLLVNISYFTFLVMR